MDALLLATQTMSFWGIFDNFMPVAGGKNKTFKNIYKTLKGTAMQII